MPTQPQRLLDLAARLLAEEPWSRIEERSIFLVRVPGRPLPVTVTIFGDTVDVHGIEVGLEPDGFRRLAKLHSPETTDAEIEAFQPGNALSLVFLPPGQILPEYRKIWKAAAFRPSGSRPAPQFAANDGGKGLRPIKRSEGTILGYCAHAVLDALEQGSLVPPDVASGDEVALLLTVPGDSADDLEEDELPEVLTDIVRWPGENGVIPPAHDVAASTLEAAGALPLSDRILALTGFESQGAPDHNVPEGAFALALFAPENDEYLASVALNSKEPSAIEGGLLALLKSTGERPELLITDHPQVALVAFAMSHLLDIRPRFGAFLSSFAALVDDTIEDLGGTPAPRLDSTLDALDALGGEDIPHDFPEACQSAADWQEAFNFTSGVLLFAAQEAELLDDAARRYWGSRKNGERTRDALTSFGAATAFLHYSFEDHRLGPDSPTAVELTIQKSIGQSDISDEERAVYAARRDSVVSLFEVSPHGPDVTDVLTGESFSVDVDLEHVCRFEGHTLPLRHYRLGPFHGFAVAGFPMEAEAKDLHLKQLSEALGAKPSHELLRSKGHRLGGMWTEWLDQLNKTLAEAAEKPAT